jgi:hypothetical protein
MKKSDVNATETSDKQGTVQRNPDGTLKKGFTANPGGRPKGKSLTSRIREALMKPSNIEGKTYEDLLVDRILVESIQNGSSKIINHLWDHVDGKAMQKIDHSTGGEPISGFTYVTPETTVPAPKPKKKKKKPTSEETDEGY